MDLSEFSIHFLNKKLPEVEITKYSDFSIVTITKDQLVIKFFFYSNQQVTDFKNTVLAAYERFTKPLQ